MFECIRHLDWCKTLLQRFVQSNSPAPSEPEVKSQTSSFRFLMLHTIDKIFSRQYFEIFFLFFPENRIWYSVQTVCNGDNLHEMSSCFLGKFHANCLQWRDSLHEMSNPIFWEKYEKCQSAELVQRVVKVDMIDKHNFRIALLSCNRFCITYLY